VGCKWALPPTILRKHIIQGVSVYACSFPSTAKPPKSQMDHLEPEFPSLLPDASAPSEVVFQSFPGVTHPVVDHEEVKLSEGLSGHGIVEAASDLALAPTRGGVTVTPSLSELETQRQKDVAIAFCNLLSGTFAHFMPCSPPYRHDFVGLVIRGTVSVDEFPD
jgi:hypothetical protein